MVVSWSDVVTLSDVGVAVFDVAPAHRRAVLAWAQDADVPHAAIRRVHEATVDAWALLDGGVVDVHDSTSLPDGARVVGFPVLRMLLADLGLAGPDAPFPGETLVPLDELRRLHARTSASPARVEQAQLLAECGEATMLRWASTVLGREELVEA